MEHPHRALSVHHRPRRRRLHPGFAAAGVQGGGGEADLPAGAAHRARLHAGGAAAPAAPSRPSRALLRDVHHPAPDLGDGDVRLRLPLVSAGGAGDRNLARVPAAHRAPRRRGKGSPAPLLPRPDAGLDESLTPLARDRRPGRTVHHRGRHPVGLPSPRLRRLHLRLDQGEPLVVDAAHADRLPLLRHRLRHRGGAADLHHLLQVAEDPHRRPLPR